MDLPRAFKLYLASQGVSSVTIRNYLSDFNHFWGWLILTLKNQGLSSTSPREIIKQITPSVIKDYKNFLFINKTPVKTINRRLSSLRRFGGFCLSQNWLKSNPARKISNLSAKNNCSQPENREQILKKFKAGLEKEKVSSVTIRNYLSDIRHFLAWIEVEI
jgi:site-specific recombinase XerD